MAETNEGNFPGKVFKEKDTPFVVSKFTPNKVSPEQKDFILQQLAEDYKSEEVVRKLFEKYDVSVHINTVKRYKALEENRILEKRRALTGELDRLASSSKFVRLKELEEQRDRLHKYQDEAIEPKSKERLLMDNSALRRTEVEGFKGILTLDPKNPFEGVQANIETINKALEELKKGKTAKTTDKGTE